VQLMASTHTPAPKLADGPVGYRSTDVEYLTVEGRTFYATIYQPEGPGPFPALLDVHGGQWTIATSSREVEAPIATFLASQGMVVMAVDFRQDTEHRYPDSVSDVNYAMRWLRANAERFNASRQPIGALGSSSGGHLVMLNSMRPADPRYAAMAVEGATAAEAGPDYVIAHSGILDPPARQEFAKLAGRADILKSTAIYFSPPEALQEANPRAILDRGEGARLAPALIVQGMEDENIDFHILEGFAEAYRKAGGEVQLALFEGAKHVFMTRTSGETAERALNTVRDFIARQLEAS